MTNSRFTRITAALALAAGLLAGCSTTYNPPEDRVVTVTPPPVVAVTPPPAAAAAGAGQSFEGTLGMTPLQAQQSGVIHLQSFAGDVCVADSAGNGSVSHCVCERTNCTCRATTATCTP